MLQASKATQSVRTAACPVKTAHSCSLPCRPARIITHLEAPILSSACGSQDLPGYGGHRSPHQTKFRGHPRPAPGGAQFAEMLVRVILIILIVVSL